MSGISSSFSYARSHGRMLVLLYVLLHLCVPSASASSSAASSGSTDTELLAPSPHCATYLDHCDFNATTASCVFRDSIAFQCGSAGGTHGTNGSTSDNGNATVTANATSYDCRWELTGDLVVADGVHVSLTGDDCALRISTNMLVLGVNATLRATSVRVDAAFVRLERQAELRATFPGTQFRGHATLFPGTAARGASNGGSGGTHLLRHNETLTPAARAFGAFFDVRLQPTHNGDNGDEEGDGSATAVAAAMARRAASAWDLETLWSSDDDDDTLLLLGSGSSGVDGGGRVRVVATRDLVLMPGAAIRANGGNAASGTGGAGAGGTVFLSAAALSLAIDSRVEARGGRAFCPRDVHGVGDCAPGGGGGRVHIAYESSQLDDHAIDVRGGALGEETDDRVAKAVHAVEQHALAGAAGTYLRVFRAAKRRVVPAASPSTSTAVPATGSASSSSEGDALPSTLVLYVDEDASASDATLIVSNQRLGPTATALPSTDETTTGTSDTDGTTPPTGHGSDGTDTLVGVGAVTPLTINATAQRRIDRLVIVDGAAVATRGLAIPQGDLELRNGSFVLDSASVGDGRGLQENKKTNKTTTEQDETIDLDARHVVVSSCARILLRSTSLSVFATSLVLDATVELRVARHVTLAAAKNLRVDARVTTPTLLDSAVAAASSSSLTIIGGSDVFLGSAGIAVGAFFVHADGSLTVTATALDASHAASIDARFQPCDPKQRTVSDPLATPRAIAASFLTVARASNFTMFLRASQSIAIGALVPSLPAVPRNGGNATMGFTLAEALPSSTGPSSSPSSPSSPVSSPSSSPVTLTGSAILLCAANEIEVGDDALIASNGRGEQANQGPGAGDCVGSVGGGAGYGGRGADSSAVNELGDYASGGLAYGTRSGIGMLGSGGGCVDGGAGGGVVMIGARGVVLNGQVHCNGDGGVRSGGGGSGGFLGLAIADFLTGGGRISAVGGGAQCVDLENNAKLRDVLQSQPLQPGEDVAAGNATAVKAVRVRLAAAVAVETAVAAETDATAKTTTVISRVCGGGGGGGRLQLHGCEKNDIDTCMRGFDGNYTVAGGATSLVHYDGGTATGTSGGETVAPASTSTATPPDDSNAVVVPAAASGSFVGFPCLPGSGGLFCRLCLPGAFKAESNSEECQPCRNAPSNAHYVGLGATSAQCEWTCDPGYSGDLCVSPIQQLLDACGGVLGFGVVLLSIVLFLILLGYACRSRKEPSYVRGGVGGHRRRQSTTHLDASGTKSERQHLLRAAIASTQRSRFACLFRWLYWPRVAYPKLVERDLPEHMARIYLTGMNDPDAPLKLRLTVPPSLASVLYDDEFRLLAERMNAVLAWPSGVVGSWGEVVYRFVVLLCYPAASAVLAYRRHVRVNALKRIVGRYNHACMKGPRARGLLNALKLGYSGDYSLVYLELLYKESAQSACVPTTAIGKPALPIVLLFAGRGTYESPFYLDPSDLLVRSIPQCPELTAFIDEPWVEFVAELNELLRVVCNKDVALVQTLLPVAQFLEKKRATATAATAAASAVFAGAPGGGGGSAASSKLGGLRIYLGRFYVGDDVDCGEEFKLGIFVTTAGHESGTYGSSLQLSDRESMMLGTGLPSTSGPASGQGSRYAYGGTGALSGPRNLDSLDGYGRALPTEDAQLVYDSVSGGWSYAPEAQGYGTTAPTGLNHRNGNNGNTNVVRRGSSTAAAALNNTNGPPSHKSTVSSIREEALRIRSNTAGSVENLLVPGGHRLSDFDTPGHPGTYGMGHGNGPRSGRSGAVSQRRRRRTRRQTFYEGWLGPVDGSLPVPGVLISADELEDRLADRTPREKLAWLVRRLVLPTNVARSTWLGAFWMVHGALLCLLMVDLAITFAMVVNLRCVANGEVDTECSAAILMPVLLLPPLTLFLAPIMGIVSLAIASNAFSRRYAIWNALSMANVAVAVLVCLTQSRRLVAPWFTAPVPVLPVIAMVVKAGEAYVVERYIAFQETNRRRRGWRGLMKRRLSDASVAVESP